MIATSGDLAQLAAKTANSTIPIVSIIGGVPVAAGFVASVVRPAEILVRTDEVTE